MGAIIMSALVSVIAIVGGVYFWIQDKKRDAEGYVIVSPSVELSS